MHCTGEDLRGREIKPQVPLLNAAMNFDNSRMYPGLPEYYDLSGRGMYAYLTGAASWYLLTMVTEVFGVKGVMEI